MGYVASFTDAWIETQAMESYADYIKSHLLQMRGLKLPAEKLEEDKRVASFTDAWIETLSLGKIKKNNCSRIFYRCVD